jgi:transposase
MEELCSIITRDEELHRSWIILDNAVIHKGDEIRDIVASVGCSLKFLSPYSFMLDPVENVILKIKTYVRNTFPTIKTKGILINQIRAGVATITDNDLRGFYTYMLENIYKSSMGLPFN